MTLSPFGVAAIALLSGCMRFGYGAQPASTDQPLDAAARNDGGSSALLDAAVPDAGRHMDAGGGDADVPDSSTPDAAHSSMEAGAMDASPPIDARVPDDSAVQTAMDSGFADGGAPDTGPADSGASATGPCAFTLTTNQYLNKPHFHGTLALQNAGATTWTMPIIVFDLPSTAYVCNDANILPGAGWTLESVAGHCAYTRAGPSVAIVPGATLTFEYSSNNPKVSSGSAPASNVSVSGCP